MPTLPTIRENNVRNTAPTNADKMMRLPWILAFTSFNTVFCILTVFGSIFILFLDELGLPKVKIGLTLSLLPFSGILALFIAPLTARVGFKRTFLIFFGLRKLVAALLLFTPFVLHRYGPHGAFVYVEAVVLIFAVFRAIAETSWNPWAQEMVPDSIRGKFSALENITALAVGLAAVGVASYVVASMTGLGRFIILIGVGVGFGLLAVGFASFIGGGSSLTPSDTGPTHFRKTLGALADRNFVRFIIGVGLVNLGTIPLASFIPLYMRDQIGLDSGNVVLLQAGGMVGGMLSCYIWGWAADRFGSKPVMLTGLNLSLLLPLCWWLTPRHSPWSSSTAMILAVIWGVVSFGWQIGFLRHLFVSIVPPAKKTEYMAIHYACAGITAGAAPLVAGHVLDACSTLSSHWFLFPLDAYTPIFIASLVLIFAAARVLGRVHAEDTISPGRFAGMFFRGNPLLAFESLIRYRVAKNEDARISVTERMAEAASPLNVEELLESLSDPSFNVRYQAIIAIARRHPEPRLTDALIEILQSNEPDLSITAASTLGRIGDPRAIPALRQALHSDYPLLRARSARALASLADTETIPLILESLRRQSEEGERLAYASALGALRCRNAVPEIFAFLHNVHSRTGRSELALTIACAFHAEEYFISLWREANTEPGTAVSRRLAVLAKRLAKLYLQPDPSLLQLLEQCRNTFAAHDLNHGARLLAQLLSQLPAEQTAPPSRHLLAACAEQLRQSGPDRIEYILLALLAVHTASIQPLSHESNHS